MMVMSEETLDQLIDGVIELVRFELSDASTFRWSQDLQARRWFEWPTEASNKYVREALRSS